MNGKELFAKLVVRESVNGQIYYNNDLSSVDEISGRAGDAPQNKPGAAAVSADRRTLVPLLAAGNPAEVSKVVDENGESLVEHHGNSIGNNGQFDPKNTDTPRSVTPAQRKPSFTVSQARSAPQAPRVQDQSTTPQASQVPPAAPNPAPAAHPDRCRAGICTKYGTSPRWRVICCCK